MKGSLLIFLFFCGSVFANLGKRWSSAKAQKWQEKYGWKAGANFIPSSAVNQLEMFQEDTYDPVTIDRELQMAENLGFNVMRVYLHDLLWSKDAEENKKFLDRVDNFLEILKKHKMSAILVLFDSCWKPNPKAGRQPAPTPGVHNSQWLQSPGKAIVESPDKFDKLKKYVHGVVGHFKNDSRIIMWDIWNEPTNSGYKEDVIAPLLNKVFVWMRQVKPRQPITTPVWQGLETAQYTPLLFTQLHSSDVISFHSYANATVLRQTIKKIRELVPDRPIICSEYMNRHVGSKFDPQLEIMRTENISAINWGLVAGKTQTIYPWTTEKVPATKEPDIWFHDIFRKDGEPYSKKEVKYIKRIMAKHYAAVAAAEERAAAAAEHSTTEAVAQTTIDSETHIEL